MMITRTAMRIIVTELVRMLPSRMGCAYDYLNDYFSFPMICRVFAQSCPSFFISEISMTQRITENPSTTKVRKRLTKIIAPWAERKPTQSRATKQIK